MRNNFKYKVSLLAIAAIFFSAIALSTNAFADSLDITITNQIDFTLPEQDSNNATISDIQITNNSDTTSILLTNIKASAATGYTLESFNSSFNTFRANSKHIGIAYDLASGARDISGSGITTTETIGTSASKTLAFTGKSSIFTTAITAEDNEYMADIVLTLETLMTDYSVTWNMNGGTGNPAQAIQIHLRLDKKSTYLRLSQPAAIGFLTTGKLVRPDRLARPNISRTQAA